MAGYVSSKDQWERLIPDWNRILLEEGVREVRGKRRLHMKELVASRGGFEGWDESRKKQLLDRLVSLLRVRVQAGFARAVPLVEYQRTEAVLGVWEVPTPHVLMMILCMRG